MDKTKFDNLNLIDESNTLKEINSNNSTLDLKSKEYIDSLLKCLNEMQYKVICMRYGLIDNNPLTLEQVALKLDISKERVRQIEATSIRKIRSQMRKS